MSLKPQPIEAIPDETVRVARAAFPKGNRYMQMRDEFGTFYQDEQFSDLFPERGQPAESPWRLALVTILQFAENLPDRAAADAVRARLDWKYALGLELSDPGFDYSILSEFRKRLLEGGAEQRLFELMLEQFQAQGLLKARGRQRTDSTHVLAAVRGLNRLELAGETLRHALNSLAVAAPDWLKTQVPAAWYERYGRPMTDFRLPRTLDARRALAEQIGRDGFVLFTYLASPDAAAWLRDLPAVETLRCVWIQQFVMMEGQLRWRQTEELPPGERLLQSPYDVEARYSKKRQTEWVGYKVHLTESCEADLPHLITNVETTAATTTDYEMTPTVHAHLAERALLPAEHFVDTGYITADQLVDSQQDYAVELVGPVQSENSWQARANEGFAIGGFVLDWEAQQATCPRAQSSRTWRVEQLPNHAAELHIHFALGDCQACAVRAQCTKSKTLPRQLTLRGTRAAFEALQTARQQQQTPAWQVRYRTRAGVEGTLSQATNPLDMRQARYRGQAKTHLQLAFTAAALNLLRVANWLAEVPFAQTRTSRFAALAA